MESFLVAVWDAMADFMLNLGILAPDTWPEDTSYDYDESLSFLSDDNYVLRWYI